MIPTLPNSNGFRGRLGDRCCVTLSGTLDQPDAGGRAAHVGKADDDLEITQLEHATAGDEHMGAGQSTRHKPQGVRPEVDLRVRRSIVAPIYPLS